MALEASRGEALQRVMEEGPGPAALKAGGRMLNPSGDPHWKEKAGLKSICLPSVLVPRLFPGSQLPWGVFLRC